MLSSWKWWKKIFFKGDVCVGEGVGGGGADRRESRTGEKKHKNINFL